MNKSFIFSLILILLGVFGFFYFQYLGNNSVEHCKALNNCSGAEGLQGLASFFFALPILLIGLILCWVSLFSKSSLLISRVYSLVGGIVGFLLFMLLGRFIFFLNIGYLGYLLIGIVGASIGIYIGRKVATV